MNQYNFLLLISLRLCNIQILSLLLIFTALFCNMINTEFRAYTSIEVRRSVTDKWVKQPSKTTKNYFVNNSHTISYNPTIQTPLHDQPERPNQIRNNYWNNYLRKNNVRNYPKSNSYYRTVSKWSKHLPPWYVHKFTRRYPRDESLNSYAGHVQLPWNYKPKCRSCGRPLLQDSFCSDDFVIRVNIYKQTTSQSGDLQYLAYVYEVYKDVKNQIQPSRFVHVVYSCDRFHDVPILGNIYLITGIYVSGELNVDSCSWKSTWSEVTREQKRFLRKRYHSMCGICQIQRVLQSNSHYVSNPNTCYISVGPRSNELSCRDKFSLCRFQKYTKRCQFTNGKSYNICTKWLTKGF